MSKQLSNWEIVKAYAEGNCVIYRDKFNAEATWNKN